MQCISSSLFETIPPGKPINLTEKFDYLTSHHILPSHRGLVPFANAACDSNHAYVKLINNMDRISAKVARPRNNEILDLVYDPTGVPGKDVSTGPPGERCSYDKSGRKLTLSCFAH